MRSPTRRLTSADAYLALAVIVLLLVAVAVTYVVTHGIVGAFLPSEQPATSPR